MGRFVKQLLLLTLALVAPGFLWAANWMHVGDTLSFSRYVDLDSLSVQGARRFYVGEVRYRTVVEYRGMLYDKVRFGAWVECDTFTVTRGRVEYLLEGHAPTQQRPAEIPSVDHGEAALVCSAAPSESVAVPTPQPEQQPPPPRPREPRSGSAQRVSSGSGFFVSTSGHVLTNAHVAQNCSTLKVKWSGGERSASIVRLDPRLDLALLDTAMQTASIATFRDGDQPEPGDDVVALGYPLSGLLASDVNVSVGLISANAGLRDDFTRYQISNPVQPGNSGGPLLDRSGHVVGVVVSKLDALRFAQITGDIPQNINFAVKGGIARIFLRDNRVQIRLGQSKARLETAPLTRAGREYTVLIESY